MLWLERGQCEDVLFFVLGSRGTRRGEATILVGTASWLSLWNILLGGKLIHTLVGILLINLKVLTMYVVEIVLVEIVQVGGSLAFQK